MKVIKAKSLQVENFKGVKKQGIKFSPDVNYIFGANKAGKTTIFDAMYWLLFGKNSEDKKDFEIKPLDEHGNIISKLENSVFGTFDVDGQELILKRTQKEKWVKEHGSAEVKFKGNETLLEWNETPLKLSEFNARIKNLIDEAFFKLLTNPLYFNSLPWKKRREMLIKLASPIADIKIAETHKLKSVINILNSNKDIADAKSEITSKIKKTKDLLKSIPTRIDEVTKGTPEPLNFIELDNTLKSNESAIAEIEGKIIDKSTVLSDFNSDRLKQDYALKGKLAEIKEYKAEFIRNNTESKKDLESKINIAKIELNNDTDALNNCHLSVSNNESARLESEVNKKNKIKEWKKLNSSTFIFDEEKSICPTCKQSLPETEISELKIKLETNFNQEKRKNLDKIEHIGANINEDLKNIKKEKEKVTHEIENIELLIKKSNEKIANLNSQLAKTTVPDIKNDPTYTKMLNDYNTELQKFNEVVAPKVDVSELETEKAKLTADNIELRKSLNIQNTIKTAENRVIELEKEEKAKGKILLDLEKVEFELNQFSKAKITSIEAEINNNFKHVNFKMFETQINGAEKETCLTLVNGVPFSDANTEGKLNAGLDIINTFSKFYQISVFTILDNRESVTDIIETEQQIINLIVDPTAKKLTIK